MRQRRDSEVLKEPCVVSTQSWIRVDGSESMITSRLLLLWQRLLVASVVVLDGWLSLSTVDYLIALT